MIREPIQRAAINEFDTPVCSVRWIGAEPHKDPWGRAEDWRAASLDQLLELLADARPAVRDRAQEALVARGKDAVPAPARLVAQTSDARTKQRAVWTLCRTDGEESLTVMRSALDDKDDDVVITAARALSRRGDRVAGRQLCQLLSGESLPVRLATAEALASCGDSESLDAVCHALTRTFLMLRPWSFASRHVRNYRF